MAPPLVGEALALFTEGISMTLSRWTALQLAVENKWGGRDSRQKAEKLASDILSWFTRSREPLYIDDLEIILEEAMDSLNTTVDDGSVTEVAENLLVMHGESLEGNYQSITNLRAASQKRASCTKQSVNADKDDSDTVGDEAMGDDGSSDMMIDLPESQPKPPSNSVEEVKEADPDGWVKVSSRNKTKKKK
ncbi:uncharacterized protein [Rutidosis leptorrhynchoides]|uniref:uncharacterized protein n=1 Tax=Rutidosis leptorrhynchoides TaxID=125765 RepID=UPI003A9A4D1F